MGGNDDQDGGFEEKPSNGTGKSYRGSSLIARTSPWFTWEDILLVTGDIAKPLTVFIEDVIERKDMVFEGGRKRDVGVALKFRGHKRELLLNTTNRRVLNNMHGTDQVTPWVGTSIEVYVQQGVKRGRDRVNAVRIRNRVIVASDGSLAQKQGEPTRAPVTRSGVATPAQLGELKNRLAAVARGDVTHVLKHFGWNDAEVAGKPLTSWPVQWVDAVLRFTGPDSDPLPPPDDARP